MLFSNKVKRVLDATKADPENAPERIELEKNDMAALLIAGFITMLPVLFILLALFLGVTWFFLR